MRKLTIIIKHQTDAFYVKRSCKEAKDNVYLRNDDIIKVVRKEKGRSKRVNRGTKSDNKHSV